MRFDLKAKDNGMYQSQFERDNCGIGLYAHINGKKSHKAVRSGIEILSKLDHRGGLGSDPDTGDGAGIMIQLPDRYFRNVCASFDLPKAYDYAVGMIFFHQDDPMFEKFKTQIELIIEKAGQKLLGWRDVPTQREKIGKKGRESAPDVWQVFVEKSPELDEVSFGRKLYKIRKQMEHLAEKDENGFYIASFSNQTIVYKGLLTSHQVDQFYVDLQDELVESSFSLVHSRFSTNTFPSWERAHPNRYLIHNGEINTLRGNINGMRAREERFKSDVFGEDISTLLPILDEKGSDSSVLDNALEFLMLAGYDPAHAAMMLIPEPWEHNPHMEPKKRAFYQFHSAMTEEWDGPTSITFTNGRQIGAILDRNGLRPARYYVTHDDTLIYASETGVIPVEEKDIKEKKRLKPGEMLYIDLDKGKIIPDFQLKDQIVKQKPYQKWLKEEMITLHDDPMVNVVKKDDLLSRQLNFGYTEEVINKYLLKVIETKTDPIGAMGMDAPLAVLSTQKQSLFNYFKQLFAQVTNPPIDAYREKLVTSTRVWLGAEGDYMEPKRKNAHRISLESPVLSPAIFNQIAGLEKPSFKSATIAYTFKKDLKRALHLLHEQAQQQIDNGATLLILSDETVSETDMVIPVLLATSSLHQYLIRKGLRSSVSLVIATGETKEVHHFASLISYGADAIYPYLVYETYANLVERGKIKQTIDYTLATYRKTIVQGIIKVMSKMGISTMQSYRGAQVFEAIGLSKEVVSEHFTGTSSVLSGIGFDVIEEEARLFHADGFKKRYHETLPSGSEFQWRKGGEHHVYNPMTLSQLQWAARRGDYTLYKRYSEQMNNEQIGFLRHLFEFKASNAIPIEEVEPVETIIKRFKTGAMSYGSISQEAHETLAIAMNRIGGKSNSGEGGEDPVRFEKLENGDSKNSAIKQVASARFGVDSHYLVNANELQIKMAQGAKPGEGGHLPGEKVYPWIAKTRRSTPGVDLISPPPHHDIYSIEDLAQLIYDLKNANNKARISVKLASKSGVGTIAAGVAKGNADVISVVGYDGGTGASPKTSIKHAGLPLELGLSEAHQTLLINGLRERVTLETDGKLLTGRDVVLSAILGAEEFGFATAPLVILGCVMMRVCHLDTCPVGVATQNPELRERFAGKAEHVVNFMTYVAQEVREIMASLGIRTVNELVGNTDLIVPGEKFKMHWKAKHLELDRLLYRPIPDWKLVKQQQIDVLPHTLDESVIIPRLLEAVKQNKKASLSIKVTNINRTVGTRLGSEISRLYGAKGLAEDTIQLNLFGSSGQSLGAFIPSGLSITLIGDANDYLGKGLSGGKLIVKTPDPLKSEAKDQVIVGNVCFYGATAGSAYINGQAGERFGVRNSGAELVVEGMGEHGLEYMTGGKVINLGNIGKNFAAGMSGGEAYLYSKDQKRTMAKVNDELVDMTQLDNEAEWTFIKGKLERHVEYTGSVLAQMILDDWETEKHNFISVIPREYQLMRDEIASLETHGSTNDDAMMVAFTAKKERKLNHQKEALNQVN